MFKQNDKTTTINHENVQQEKNFCYFSQENAGLPTLILYRLRFEELDCKAYSKKFAFTIGSDEGLSTQSLESQVPVLTSRYSAKSFFLCSTI